MSSRLEQFIKDHREEFDSEEPSKKVWENIRNQSEPAEKKPTPVVTFNFVRWSVAAAVVMLLAGGSIWYFKSHQNNTPTATAGVTQEPPKDTSSSTAKTPVSNTPDSSANQLAQSPANLTNDTKGGTLADDVNEEMYHYAKLVEIKHKELKKIEKDEPLLYKQFSSDVNKLDSVYHSLQKQLPNNPNQEQLLEAMKQNLQLQMDLLDHQLNIIKQINQKKQSAYEKAYKSA